MSADSAPSTHRGAMSPKRCARLVESASAHKQAERPTIVLRIEQSILSGHVRNRIHGPALVRSLLDETVGPDWPARSQQPPRANLGLEQTAGVIRSQAAVAQTHFA